MSSPFSNLPVSSDVGILLQDVNASWTEDGPITLRNLNLTVPKGKLCAIIGSVGSGKVGIRTTSSVFQTYFLRMCFLNFLFLSRVQFYNFC